MSEVTGVGDSFMDTLLERIIKNCYSSLSSFKIIRDNDPNNNYGGHHDTLNFPEGAENHSSSSMNDWLKDSSLLPNGNGTFGTVKDKEGPTDRTVGQPDSTSRGSAGRWQLLLDIQEHLNLASSHRFSNASGGRMSKDRAHFMRVNIVKGAATIAHTDVLRSCMSPNYLVIFNTPEMERLNSKFVLKVWTWPLFKTSFVWYPRKGYCIPFDYKASGGKAFNYKKGCGGFLKLIWYDEFAGVLKWIICPPSHVSELKPGFKLPEDHAVAGFTQDGGLYILKREYSVYPSWTDVPQMKWSDLRHQSSRKDKKSRYKFRFLTDQKVLHKFNGWENIHEVLTEKHGAHAKSDLNAVRLHVFMRDVRTVGVGAQASWRRGNIEIINE